MRLLHLSDRLSVRGGADLHLRGVLERLATRHEVTLAVGRVEGDAAPPRGVTVERVKGLDSPDAVQPGVAARLEQLAASLKPDCIHVHTAMAPVVLGWAVEHPCVITLQDHRVFCPGMEKLTLVGEVCEVPMSREPCSACLPDPEYLDHILELTGMRLESVKRASAVTVLSEYMAGELSRVGVQRERVHVIPPWPNMPQHPDVIATGAPVVLYSGRVIQRKGVFDLVEAMQQVPGATLVVAGDGTARADLIARAAELKVPLEAPGWLDRAQLAERLGGARVLVLPSLSPESFGIAGLEALASGVPVVAYATGGIPEWLGGGGGVLVRRGHIPGLARAIAAIVADEEGGKKLGAAGRERVEHAYRPGALIAALERVYQGI